MQFQLVTLTCLVLAMSALAESAKQEDRSEDSGNYGAGAEVDSPAEVEVSGAGEHQQQQGHGGPLDKVGGDMLADLLGSKKGAPPNAEGADFFGLKLTGEQKGMVKGFGDLTKLIFNPFELVRSICGHFKIPLDKIIEKLGKSSVLGIEALLYPLVASVRIIEKVFVPDACRLKFICKMGRHLDFVRDSVLRFSPNFLEGSSHIKALSEGIVGHDCEKVFDKCEPKLQKPYEDLKVTSPAGEHYGGGGGDKEIKRGGMFGGLADALNARGIDESRPIGGVVTGSAAAGPKQRLNQVNNVQGAGRSSTIAN